MLPDKLYLIPQQMDFMNSQPYEVSEHPRSMDTYALRPRGDTTNGYDTLTKKMKEGSVAHIDMGMGAPSAVIGLEES